MPDKVSLPAGSRISRLLVFKGNFTLHGESTLSIPLFDADGGLVEKLEFSFSF